MSILDFNDTPRLGIPPGFSGMREMGYELLW